jgi:uncharacterized protein (TIGR02266 family)
VDTNTRQAKRAPVTLKIKFKSATLDQFIERYAVDVSPGGIFIRTKEPLGVGTQMRFEFQLRDATPLITGEGTVVWTRENDPTRPAAAPGMGVRFDRLGEGSQAILDKILAEKAKQPAAQPVHDSGAPKGFLEVPTKVAPSPLVGALANESKPKLGQLSPSRGGFADERTDNTPLPRPMPFHSDAEEFPDEAFEEATKVRALDELVAATAIGSAREGGLARTVPARPEPVAPKAEPVVPKAEPVAPIAAKAEPVAPKSDPGKSSVPLPAPDLSTEVPLIPQVPARPATKSAPPPVAAAVPIIADEPLPPPAPAKPSPSDELAARRSRPLELREEPAPKPAREPAPRLVPAAERSTPASPPASAVSAAASAMPEPSSKAPAAVVVGLLMAAVVAAAVWFVFLRKPQESTDVAAGTNPATAPATNVATGGTQAPAVAIDAAEAAVADVDAAGAAVPAANTLDTEIKVSVPGATVAVEGAGTGPAPFTAKLEKGKTYKLIVSADSFKPVELEIKGGDTLPTVKLEPLPRTLHVTSTPPGAMILIDGAPTGKKTPADITLTKAQVGARSVKLSLRRTGFAPFNKVVAKGEFVADDTGGAMTVALDATLTAVRPTGGGGGGGGGGTDPGTGAGTSGTGTGTGAGTAGSGTGTAGTGTGTAGTGTGTAGSGTGTAGSGTGTAGSGTGTAQLPGTGTGTGAGTGAGTAGSGTGTAKPPGTGTGTGAGTGAGTAKPPGTGTGAGTASGTGEPTPDWMKP